MRQTLKGQRKLHNIKWDILCHPPYSPNNSPCDYYLFSSLSYFQCNKRHNSEEFKIDLYFNFKNSE